MADPAVYDMQVAQMGKQKALIDQISAHQMPIVDAFSAAAPAR
jgi:hypothetical protein